MFVYRRKRSLGCEQLEGRFAPSSVLVGAGGRSTFKDAQALENAQAEQAASYLAASAVMSQSSSVANVAPVSDVQRLDFSKMPVFTMYQMPDGRIHCMGGSIRPMHREGSVGLPQSTGDGTASHGQSADESGVSADIPASNTSGNNNASPPSNDATPAVVEPVSNLRTPYTNGEHIRPAEKGYCVFPDLQERIVIIPGLDASTPSTDAAPVVVEPVDQQPAGVDDPAVVDAQPVSDSSPVTGDNVTDPTSVDNCPPITDASGGTALDAVPFEPQSEDAVEEATPVDA